MIKREDLVDVVCGMLNRYEEIARHCDPTDTNDEDKRPLLCMARCICPLLDLLDMNYDVFASGLIKSVEDYDIKYFEDVEDE